MYICLLGLLSDSFLGRYFGRFLFLRLSRFLFLFGCRLGFCDKLIIADGEIGKERIHRVCKACDGIVRFVRLCLFGRLVRKHWRDLFLRGSFFGFILSLRFFLVCGRLDIFLCCRCRCGLGLGHSIAVIKERYLIIRYLRRRYLKCRCFVLKLVYRQHKVRYLIRALLIFVSALRVDLELSLLGVICTREYDSLAGGGDEVLQQCLLTFGLVEHSVIHCKSCLPVLFIHKGQQSPKLRKKLLSVNTLHLR